MLLPNASPENESSHVAGGGGGRKEWEGWERGRGSPAAMGSSHGHLRLEGPRTRALVPSGNLHAESHL